MAFIKLETDLLALGIHEAIMVTVISSWSKNKKEHFLSREEYCDLYKTSKNTYKRCLKKLKEHGIIKVVRKLTNNRSVLIIDNDELAFTLENGYRPKLSQQPGHNEPAKGPKEASNRPITDLPKAHIKPTHILDKVLDNVTKEDTIKSTKPEEFSFDIFKEEVKPDDIDLKIAALAIDFDNDY